MYRWFEFKIIKFFMKIVAIIFQIFLKSDYSFEGDQEKSSYIYENDEYNILFYTFLSKCLFYTTNIKIKYKIQ